MKGGKRSGRCDVGFGHICEGVCDYEEWSIGG